MLTLNWYLVYTIALICGSWCANYVFNTRAKLPLPPGPPGHWLFGHQLPRSRAPFIFAKMIEEYGPVFSLRQGTRIFIIIGRYQAAMDIMEKQGASLADRPRSIAAVAEFSWALHTTLQPKFAETYEPIQVRHAKNLLLDIIEDPLNHEMHVKRYAADPEVVAVNRCLTRFGEAIRPGAYLVDTYPVLKYVPGYLTQLKKWHKEELALYQGQLDLVRQKIRKGDARPCFAKFLLENQEEYEISANEMAYVAGSMFGAGSETTASAITIMMMAAALHPEAQTRAQEELDNVVGRERLPSFGDQEMLPQVTAFMLECLRWRPVSMGGFAHRATSDITWRNYLIPKGATVIGNHWAIANDPEVFPNPEIFDSQRWLTAEGKLRDDLRFCTFGFGRRICPGLHVANRSVFINTAFILWAFRVSEDPAAPIDSFAFSDTANIHAMPFQSAFETRLPEAEIKKLCVVSLGGM